MCISCHSITFLKQRYAVLYVLIAITLKYFLLSIKPLFRLVYFNGFMQTSNRVVKAFI